MNKLKIKSLAFSNNVFDREILQKKEFIEMVEHLINTIKLLDISDKDEQSISEETIRVLRDFGILRTDENIQDLQGIIGETLLKKLVSEINKLINIDISNIVELKKFCLKLRNEISTDKFKEKYTFVDLFCGAGGLSLGISQAGFQSVLANDVDKTALRTYHFNHPEIEGKNIILDGIENIVGNIKKYIEEDIDLVIGGPPCQGFSNANRQRIIDDPRNNLYKYYVQAIHILKPKAFIMENVRGMEKVAEQVISDVNSQNANYYISYKVLNALNMGIPQNRERLIFIGIRKDISEITENHAKKLLNEIEFKNFKLDNSFFPAIRDLKKVSASRKKNSTKGDKESGYIIDRNLEEEKSEYVKTINNGYENGFIFNHKARYNNDRDIEIFSRMLPGDKSDSPRIVDIMPYKSRSHIFKDKYYKLIPDKYCKAITAHMKFDCNMYIHPFQARGLTPREAARIQSYPDDYFFLGAYTKTFQQIGNSVPPLMGKIIGEEIYNFLKENTTKV
ncbi:DNA cytosine methyltransferase [Staphylococcus hominis]|uniref:DNA cytosine methyltransferase n=1 Tax=Staphylococcus hominis TaxID=1290 RepID=UPI00287A33A7|nr:DNA cytosine methyltransferase [Staphylococcus hominis]MDS3873942.1 DNA cytosine methyltransferase [Staphylococcus hominis]